MKTKNIAKKLTLLKETISNLSLEEQSKVKGQGKTYPCIDTWTTCPTAVVEQCRTEVIC